MKKITALVLALLLLFTWASATAETMGTRLELASIKLSRLGTEDDSETRLHGMTLSLAVGNVDGKPTLQTTLDYGDEQVDSVFQIVDNRLLLGLGGISGTYYVDLDAFTEGQGALMGKALGAAVGMFAMNPDLVLDMVMPKSEKGVRAWSKKFPREDYRAAAEVVLGLLGRFGDAVAEGAESLRELVYASKKAVKLAVRYNTTNEKLRIRLTRASVGHQLRSRLKIVTEPMEFIDLSADPEPHDLMNLDEETLTNLKDELDFLTMKYGFFAKSTHLDGLSD